MWSLQGRRRARPPRVTIWNEGQATSDDRLSFVTAVCDGYKEGVMLDAPGN